MTTTSKIGSTLTGKFSDIVDFLFTGGADEVDRLACRAISVILATDGPQTGDEANTDPFVANQLASAALVALSEKIKHYPFVRRSSDDLADFESQMLGITDDVVASSRSLVERAEALVPSREQPHLGTKPSADLTAAVDTLILDIFEQTGLLPSAVFVIVLDDDGADRGNAAEGDCSTFQNEAAVS